jgi:hypothetical protein
LLMGWIALDEKKDNEEKSGIWKISFRREIF